MALVRLIFTVFLVFWTLSLYHSCAEETVNDDLLARMLALEKKEQKQAELLQQVESKLNRQDTIIEEYKHKVSHMELAIAQLQEERSKSERPKTNVSLRHNRLVLEGPVAFHAVVKKVGATEHIGINQKIVFPDVITNLGGGYNNQHGIFTATQPGVYIFSTSILSYSHGHVEIMVHLIKNGAILANAYAHGDSGRHDQGSVTVTTQLSAGDQVWVDLYLPADASMWGDWFDSFMGCLVTPL